MSSLNQHLIAIDYAIGNRIAPPDPILENNSWETISLIARAGKASQYWNIGDYKNTPYNNVVYRCTIVDFDHDIPANPDDYGRGLCGITFSFGPINMPSYYSLPTSAAFNTSNGNFGGWQNCSLRLLTLPLVLSGIAADLASVVVEKETIAGIQSGVAVTTVIDKLFIPSYTELTGRQYTTPADGTRYAIYSEFNPDADVGYRRFQGGPTPETYFTRSNSINNNSFVAMTGTGGLTFLNAATNSYQAAFFCV